MDPIALYVHSIANTHYVQHLFVCPSVHPCVCLSDSLIFLVVTYHYVSQATNAFLRMLLFWFVVGWLVVLRIYMYFASVEFQPYRDLEAGDNQSLKIQVARPGIQPRSSCSASQELNHLELPKVCCNIY